MNNTTNVVTVGVIFTILLIAFLFWFFPVYGVWQQGLSGEAMLKKATMTKQVMIETARAEKESAQLRADAIEIMGAAAQKFPEYRQQEFMQAFGEALREGNISQIIYVPTESNIPILEAGKR